MCVCHVMRSSYCEGAKNTSHIHPAAAAHTEQGCCIKWNKSGAQYQEGKPANMFNEILKATSNLTLDFRHLVNSFRT